MWYKCTGGGTITVKGATFTKQHTQSIHENRNEPGCVQLTADRRTKTRITASCRHSPQLESAVIASVCRSRQYARNFARRVEAIQNTNQRNKTPNARTNNAEKPGVLVMAQTTRDCVNSLSSSTSRYSLPKATVDWTTTTVRKCAQQLVVLDNYSLKTNCATTSCSGQLPSENLRN